MDGLTSGFIFYLICRQVKLKSTDSVRLKRCNEIPDLRNLRKYLIEVTVVLKISVEKAIARAKSSFKSGDFGVAKELYQNILQTFPHNKRAKRGLAEVLRNQTKLSQSSIQTDIERLGQMYNKGNFSYVIQKANSIIKHFPKEVSIWEFLGAAHRGLGNIKEAVAAFKTVVEINPYYAEGHNNLGVTFQDQGKYCLLYTSDAADE